MRSLYTVCGMLAVFTGLAMAEDWNGRLLDASCYDQNKTAKPCDATSSTTSFVFDVAGKVYKLDAAGNSKATDAVKNRADRAAGDTKTAAGPVNAKITGAMDGTDSIKVEKVEVQ